MCEDRQFVWNCLIDRFRSLPCFLRSPSGIISLLQCTLVPAPTRPPLCFYCQLCYVSIGYRPNNTIVYILFEAADS